jgi:hypothetical protein
MYRDCATLAVGEGGDPGLSPGEDLLGSVERQATWMVSELGTGLQYLDQRHPVTAVGSGRARSTQRRRIRLVHRPGESDLPRTSSGCMLSMESPLILGWKYGSLHVRGSIRAIVNLDDDPSTFVTMLQLVPRLGARRRQWGRGLAGSLGDICAAAAETTGSTSAWNTMGTGLDVGGTGIR